MPVILGIASQAIADVQCPGTFAEWNEWRNQMALKIALGAYPIEGELFFTDEFPELLVPQLTPDDGRTKEMLSSCATELSQQKFFTDPSFLGCMQRVQEAIGWRENRYFTEGQLLSPVSAHHELPADFTSPEVLRLFRGGNLSQKDFSRVMKDVAKKIPEMKLFQFKSRISGTDRVFVGLIPGETYDKYIHTEMFSSSVADENSRGHFLVLTVVKKDSGGKPLTPPVVYFNEFREEEKGGKVVRTTANRPHPALGKAADARTLRCVVCHRTGGMPIVFDKKAPVISFAPDISSSKIVDWFNGRVRATANSRMHDGKYMGFGPPLGPEDASSRTDEFLQKCSEDPKLSANQLKRVRSAMNCAKCHDGDSVGELSHPLGTHSFGTKVIDQMILSGHMPPKSTLTEPERKALLRCLLAEYYGGFEKESLSPGKKKPWPPQVQEGLYYRFLTQSPCPTREKSADSTTTKLTGAKEHPIPAEEIPNPDPQRSSKVAR